VTGAQLLVLALLAAAFAAGWIARRDNRSDDSDGDAGWRDLTQHIAAARGALARAMTAYGAAREDARGPSDDGQPAGAREAQLAFVTAIDSLEATRGGLVDRLGATHPLAEDCAEAVTALSLLRDELAVAGDGDPIDAAVTGAVESAARQAHARFERSASALLLLDATARPRLR